MKSAYDEAFSHLNNAQRQAVEYTEGPLMVLAGPGTGKTQLLSTRVAYILKNTDAAPDNILCLTFTEKAANNMKQRMLDIIGVEARHVAVKTFHGLGAEIIASYPDYFYNSAQLEPAPEAIKLQLVDKILSKLPLDNPLALKFAGQNTLVRDVQSGVDQAKKAGFTPDKLKVVAQTNLAYIDMVEPLMQDLLNKRLSSAVIDEYTTIIEQLPDIPMDIKPISSLSQVMKESLTEAIHESQESGKTAPLSAWKSRWTQVVDGRRVFKDRKRNEWWLALAGFYAEYQRELNAKGYFDFADMILDVLTEIENNETLRTELQERFSYILLDEFQDTNDAQLRLAHLLADSLAAEGQPNIMAVGDDDQAIYRFQGAEISNAKTFLNAYKGTKLIVLTDNYRSTQAVLDTAQIVAGKIEHRLINQLDGISKKLTAKNSIASGEIVHKIYATQAHQLTGLADEIGPRLKADISKSIAVLARNHDSLQRLAHILHQKNIPVRYERRNNVFDHPVLRLVINLLKVVRSINAGDQVKTNSLLAGILANQALSIDARKLWQLAIDNRFEPNWLGSVLDDDELQAIGKWLLEIAKNTQTEPLMVIIEQLIGLRAVAEIDSPLREYLLGDAKVTDEYIGTLSAIQSLRSLATDFSRTEEPSLDSFIDFLELNDNYKVVIADESAFVTGGHAVQLMTVYKAKGLEFDTVYVIDATDKVWSPNRQRRLPPANLESLQAYGEDPDDYSRLMFVAATRAKSNLIFTSFSSDEHGNEVLSSPLIHEVTKQTNDDSQLDLVKVIENEIIWPELRNGDAKLLLMPILENYQLSVTHLLNFLDLEKGGPQYFLERNILRLPSAKTASLAYGTAIHAALRTAQLLTNRSGLEIAVITKVFADKLHDEGLPDAEEKRYLDKGQQLIKSLFDQNRLYMQPGGMPEKHVSGVLLDNARLKGDMDLVIETDNQLKIIDYKTGSPLKSALDTTNKTDGLKAFRHRMQLIFYGLLARESGLTKTGHTMVGEMIYLESQTERDFRRTYQPSDEDIDKLANLIEAVWAKIMTLDWPDTSSYSSDYAGTQAFVNDLITRKI